MTFQKKLLPKKCYGHNTILKPKGILIHYFSAIYVDKQHAFEPWRCWQLFVELGLSAHYLIDREGGIIQIVPRHRQAWHAGKSKFKKLEGLNKSFIGYEFIATHRSGFTDAQYQTGAKLAERDMDAFGIQPEYIKGHEHVSGKDVRPDFKRDPGPRWDWLRFYNEIETLETTYKN